jgi:hypothetical protein
MNGLALAPRPPARIPARMLAPPDQLRIEQTIQAIEAATGGSRELDAACYRSIGWEVAYDTRAPRRTWRCRAPAATAWQILPDPSRSREEAARLVPWGWSEGCGTRNRRGFGWAAPAWPIREGTPFFECTGASAALALCKAALFAQRYLAMRRAAP